MSELNAFCKTRPENEHVASEVGAVLYLVGLHVKGKEN
jgi:hypothetical protein